MNILTKCGEFINNWVKKKQFEKMVSILLDGYLLCLIISSGISKQKNAFTQLLSINLEVSCLLIV